MDLSRVRPQDETMQDDHRTTPKAFLHYERARALGGVTLRGTRPVVSPAGRPGADAALLADGAAAEPELGWLAPGHGGHGPRFERSRSVPRLEHGLRRAFHLLQLLHRRLGAAAGGAVLQARIEQRLRQIGILRRRIHRAPPAVDVLQEEQSPCRWPAACSASPARSRMPVASFMASRHGGWERSGPRCSRRTSRRAAC